jgi:hypothetical protein
MNNNFVNVVGYQLEKIHTGESNGCLIQIIPMYQ